MFDKLVRTRWNAEQSQTHSLKATHTIKGSSKCACAGCSVSAHCPLRRIGCQAANRSG
ncbi:hypothetical protein HCEG_01881 [Histoplasma capsulatum var. duboisii H88]|uniref:Uncharacterized protein n=2 Tax=Ajellomyces capsulatus TaxID=5037 RepID=F0UD71_AJEC8|nr:hypothetical protein HCDG_02469 [Histoplasma capsulatum H143]EGC42666.1 hypothetical protein HCEG_01881 [Histoplasma capsulatum var. duboisii H88]